MPCDATKLEHVPLFAPLSAEARGAVAESTTVRHYRRGMFVFSEGEPPESFHFVIRGRVRVFRDAPDGREQIIHVLEQGALMAIVCFVEGAPYPASAQTLEDSEVGSIRNADFARLVRAHGDLAWTMLVQFARRLLRVQDTVYNLGSHGAAARVASVLLRFGRDTGRTREDGRIVADLPLSHRDIGAMTGVSRETVTRTLGQFRETGAVRWTEDGLLVLDPRALADWEDA